MILKPVTKEGLEKVRLWRNDCLESLRTPYPLTEKQQSDFYERLSDDSMTHRYYELWKEEFIGLGGLTHIQWENRCAEISLILSPYHRGQGYGQQAVKELLGNAFNELNLNMVFGECYECNPSCTFWINIMTKYDGYVTHLKSRKYWNGKYYDSIYFSILKSEYEKSI